MSGMTLLAVIVISALVGALTGTLVSLAADWVRGESRRMDQDLAELGRATDADLGHEWIGYSDYRFCSRCGIHEARVRGGAL